MIPIAKELMMYGNTVWKTSEDTLPGIVVPRSVDSPTDAGISA
jgi:hypothetical protein